MKQKPAISRHSEPQTNASCDRTRSKGDNFMTFMLLYVFTGNVLSKSKFNSIKDQHADLYFL